MNLSVNSTSSTAQAIEIAIRLGLIFLILAWCLQILTPFIAIVAWGAIIAVAIYNPYLKLVEKLGGRKKLAVTLIAVMGIGIILVPIISLSSSMVDGATELGDQISEGKIHVPPPPAYVEEWPVVGKKTYNLWLQASDNLRSVLARYPDQLTAIGKKMLGAAAGVGGGVLQFIVSFLIATVFLVSADGANAGLKRMANRLSPNQGEELLEMSTSTIRSVAVGVIGIAFIQAVLGGLGMMFAGVPAAGLLAIFILVLAIAQLPPLLILGPVAFYVFSAESTTVAVIFLIWSLLVSFSDAVLKPLFLGRGVDVPMLVILLGAIGGMITSGIVGLFVGAIVLALGYKLVGEWLQWGELETENPEQEV
ncbi:MAG: AI-2E family transporter [Xanthomonadales bacterium]|nr:AI-2E family transporter [Xanthomonadales bacterium]MDH4018198.1 AI-2E family transporter [Xanthomonadales bacterium]